MNRVLSIVLFTPLLFSAPATASDASAIDQAELVRRTQLLYDALAPGDRRPWELYLAADAMLCDEVGHVMGKTDMIASVQGLPKGYSGAIAVVKSQSRFAPGVAVLSYDLDESEVVFGQKLHARYHGTDTWLFREHDWRMISSQMLRYYEDPAAAQVSAQALKDYIGTYELAPDVDMVVTVQDGQLLAQRGSGKPYKLLLESADLFFRPGVEGRRLFHRDASGRVDTMIDRRNNEDLLWKKIG